MNKEFIPYEEALAMKELGFDDFSFGVYLPGLKEKVEIIPQGLWNEEVFTEKGFIKAPLYQQAFRWLQEKSFDEDGNSLVQDYLDTRWFRTLYSPVHQDITLKECIRIFTEEDEEQEEPSRGSCDECGEGFDNEEDWRYNTECEFCGEPIPEHLIIKEDEE